MPTVKNRRPLRHGDRVAYAAGPSVRKLELLRLQTTWATDAPRCYDLGTVVVSGSGDASVIWDDAEVYVDDVVASTGLLWEDTVRGGVTYAVVTPGSRRSTREERRWRAAKALRRLDAYCRDA